MSDERAETEPSLARIIASAAHSDMAESPGELRWAAKSLAIAINIDPEWAAVQTTLRQMTNENTLDGILARAQAAMAEILNKLAPTPVAQWRVLDRPSTDEMQVAEADLRSQLPEIARQLPEVETAADEITANPEKRRAIERISAIVKDADASKLSPLALLVVLWWILGMASPQEVAVLAVWYAIARDYLKKD